MKLLKKLLIFAIFIVSLNAALALCVSAGGDEHEMELGERYEIALSGETDFQRVKFIPKTDGWYAFYTEGEIDTGGYLYDSEENELDYDDDSGKKYNCLIKYKLTAGETYYFKVSHCEDDGSYNTTVVIDKTHVVVSGRVVSEPHDKNVVVFKDEDGYEDYEYNLAGLEIEFEISDGSVDVWSTAANRSFFDGQTVEARFLKEDGRYLMKVYCEEAVVAYELTPIENPVSHIEYVGSPIDIYGIRESVYYYGYVMPKDTTVKVYYTDGRVESGSVYDLFYYGNMYTYDFHGYCEPGWHPDRENYIYVEYMEKETKIPVNLYPSEVASIVVNTQPSKKYIFCDEKYGYYFKDDEEYRIDEFDISDMTFTVTFNDGSTRTYTKDDYDFESNAYLNQFVEFPSLHVKCPGIYTHTLYFMEHPLPISVEVLASPLESMEIVKVPDNKYSSYPYFYPKLNGMTVCLETKGGTKEIVATEENTKYSYGYRTVRFVIVEGEYEITGYYDDGEIKISCMDKQASCTIECDLSRVALGAEIHQLKNGIFGTEIKVYYEDGTEEIIVLNKSYDFEYSIKQNSSDFEYAYALDCGNYIIPLAVSVCDSFGEPTYVYVSIDGYYYLMESCYCEHNFGEYEPNGDATCKADGTKTAECEKCGITDTKEDEGSTLEHKYENGACISCGAEKDHSGCKESASGWQRFWNSVFNLLRRIFTGKIKCTCGDMIPTRKK